MTYNFSKPIMDAINLNDSEAMKAAKIAPMIRMLHCGKTQRASVISFRSIQKIDPTDPLYKGIVLWANNAKELPTLFKEHTDKYGVEPAIVVVKDICSFAIGKHMQEAAKTLEIFFDYAGCSELKQLIRHKESYVKAPNTNKRLYQKIIIVTGAAQGFGAGIAEYAVKNGAYVLVTDINFYGAKAVASDLCKKYGDFCAFPIHMDVTKEDSVKNAINTAVRLYGGLDVFISNAGGLKAGSLEELTLDDFMYITNLNYVAFFICTKYASAIMKIQNKINPEYWMDIIQINSKSGLTGSNKNSAYAGSKFGSLGLVQSFAMELVDFNIKVNAICPGNYLNGPLWSDPINGLFTQYLRTNKIKGAKTVQDLINHYNGKVPMRRSCEVDDVAKAILYVIEQKYETGQAVPVTGGQIMLK